MTATKFAQALDDCVINFDSRILITDLLQEYNLSYEEVHKTLEKYIKQQENKGTKYEKRFLVQGFEQEGDNEIYTIVKGESKLHEWIKKLKNAESHLYAVEVSGGARTPAQIFKPVEKCTILIENMEKRMPGDVNGSNLNSKAHTTAATIIVASAPVATTKSTEKKIINPLARKTTTTVVASTIKSEPVAITETEEPKPEEGKQPAKISPKETKTIGKKNVNKQQSVLNMFSAAASKKPSTKPATETKPTAVKHDEDCSFDNKSAVTLPKSTKQADDIKQESSDIIKLSCTEGSLEKSSDSSDEEEAISALKLEIVDSDNDTEEQPTANKRRRVIDSDDEDEPEQKHEKVDAIEIADEEDNTASKSETFLDDEDFVVTIKSKGNTTKKSSPRLKPAAKVPVKRKPPAAPSTKTKQANITNFFTKK